MQHFPKVLILAAALASGAAWAQTPSPAPAAPVPSAAATATPNIDHTAEIVATENRRGKIESDLKTETPTPASLCDAAASLSRVVEARRGESAKLLAAKPSLDRVRELAAEWQQRKEGLAALKTELTRRSDAYQNQAAELDKIVASVSDWTKLVKDGTLPRADWEKRLDALAKAARKNRDTLLKLKSDLTAPLASVHEQELKIDEMLAAIDQAQPQAVARLFSAESDPLWRIPIWSESRRMAAGLNVGRESRAAWDRQWTVLTSYVQAQSGVLLIHAAAFAALLFGLWWARRRVNAWADDEPSLKQATVVFEVPTSMAIAFSLMAFPWIYPQAPRLLIAIAGAAALIPAILILRRLLDRHLFPVLNLLVVFYFVDQLRTIAEGFPIAARLLFLAEMAGGCGFLAWMLWARRLAPQRQQDARLARATINAAKLELGVLLAALFANAIGCVDLGNLAGDAALGSAYLAVVLYAASRIVDGFIIGALSVEPLSTLGAVRHHRTLIWRRTHFFFKAVAVVVWALGTLELLTVRADAMEKAKALVWNGDDLTLLGQILAFGAVVWAAFLLSRFIRFMLEEDFYPRVKMERGLSYAVSTMLHYTLLLIGFSMGASYAGVDMTKFTILVSAFGVGMGFGLQNIINNFVSGVILLFERPVKVGDVVQLDAATSGTVDRIGIRASVIRTGNGSEIILPNGKLISDQVINWTLSNRQRGIDVTVNAAYGADPCRVIEVLRGIAAAHPLIAKQPAPGALLAELEPNSLQFKLTAWTDHIEACAQIRSDLAMAILAAFEKEGIQRPPTAITPALTQAALR